ncbi:MAG TPA: DUF3429 domain-containing protein, partial [Hydrogenophaga sp.]
MTLPVATQSDDPRDIALVHTLGYGGLIPLVVLAALVWLVANDLQTWVAMALVTYAALIVSFLGGIHWGIAWQAGMRERVDRQTPRALHA